MILEPVLWNLGDSQLEGKTVPVIPYFVGGGHRVVKCELLRKGLSKRVPIPHSHHHTVQEENVILCWG